MPAIDCSVRPTELVLGLGLACLTADVFEPELGVGLNEAAQQLDALGIVERDDRSSVLGHPVVAADEVLCFAHDDGAYLELADEAAAIPARRKRRDHDAVGVMPPPSRITESRRLGMGRGVVVLDTAVVPAPEQCPVAMEEGRPDGDPTFGQPHPGFLARHR